MLYFIYILSFCGGMYVILHIYSVILRGSYDRRGVKSCCLGNKYSSIFHTILQGLLKLRRGGNSCHTRENIVNS